MSPIEALEQGLRLHQAGRLAEAEPYYEAALRAEPDSHAALHLMGMLRLHQQNLPEARGLMEKALRQQPEAPDTLLYYGATLTAMGARDEALKVLERAIATAPNAAAKAQGFAIRGEVFLAQERVAEALADFDRAVADNPGLVAAWNNRGLALNSLKRFDAALDSFDRVLAMMPGSVEAHNNRGDALRELRRYDEALASFARALAIAPRDWATLNNRAIALSAMNRLDEALADYDRALSVEPNIVQALFARGNLLWGKKSRLAPALADLERLVKVAPDFPFGRGSLMRLKMTAAQWDGFAAEKALLDDEVRAGKPVIEPFIYLALSDDPADLKQCAEIHARRRFPTQATAMTSRPKRSGKIRLGYVCGEFRTHATLYLMSGLFEAHDKSRFEIIAFDNGGGDGGVLRARFEAAVDKIVDITALSDDAAAARVRAEGIDILVDLNGYSGNQRAGLFAHRPAPVQVGYLAYPGTLGATFLDYIIADRIVIPQSHAAHYSEKIAWLPHSYQINDNKRAVGQTPSRAAAGLPQEAFVFCNFNHVNKFTPDTFSRWLRILDQTPGSLLWLLKPDTLAMDNLKRESVARGLDPARLLFAESLPFEDHLARLALADLFLDGQPYGAHTTASDALWAGLPLITRAGGAFAGRVASSLLTALEMPEMIAQDDAGFEALALRLARAPAELALLRDKLQEKKRMAPLFDTARTTRAIETAFVMMLEKRTPESFVV